MSVAANNNNLFFFIRAIMSDSEAVAVHNSNYCQLFIIHHMSRAT